MLGRCSDCNNNLDSSHNSFEEGIKQTRDVPETSREESPNSITKEENTSQLHERDLFIHTGQGRPRKNFLTVKNDADLYDKKDVVPLLQEQSYNHHNQNQSRLYQRESGSFCSAPCTTRGPFPKLTSSLPKWISSKCALDTGSQYLNCSYRGLLNVPDNPCPVNCTFGTIRTYNLQNNNVTTIHNCTFSRFEQLEVLDLSSNNLNSLEPRAFYGLKYLKDLNLWGNSLKMSAENFPPCIFSDLQSLKKLQINRNDDRIKSGGLDYPDEALSYLSRLTNLSMDGQYAKEFGPGFKSLTSLTHVILEGYLTGYCNISILTETTFQNVPYIRHLSIGSCYIVRIHPNAFSFLQQLESLDLNHNEDIDIIHLPHVFHSLRNITTLKHLNMKLVVNRYSIGICLDHQYLEDFPQHLESLNVQENNIEGIDRSVISRLSPTLKTLDVSGNRFVFGTYLKDLHLMENLIHLRINGGSFTYYLPGIYPYQLLREQNDQSNCTLYGGGALYYNNLTFVLRLPPRLETIEMNNAGLRYLLSALKIDSRNNLTKLSMAGNKFPKLIGPFIGFANLKHLDLSTCYVEKIKSTFFSHLQSLELLNLGANLLGDFLAQNAEPKLFSSLINLKTLNLTFNDISALPEDIFSGLDKMEYLLLYRNPLQRFDVSIIHMHNLQELDLDNTRIQLLDKATRDHIDMLSGKGQNVTVDVERCPIMCDCDNLDFLKWMQKSKSVDLTNSFSYVCTYPDTSLKAIMDGYADTIQVLGRECTSQEMLLFFVGAATSIMIITIICAILYRFRWNIRYLYYAAHSIYHGKISKTEETDFRYDAFICYDAQDDDFVLGKLSPELERRGLKMCIHSRDFIAGDYIASNIVKAVCSSRKTVVVLTRNLIDSYWCGFEMQMAKLESVYSGRSVLIFLLMETIPESVLGVDILYNIRNNTYIPYPDPLPDATSMGRLWDKLASDITS
nr:toll-like receptor 4 [Onchidium reevesii]